VADDVTPAPAVDAADQTIAVDPTSGEAGVDYSEIAGDPALPSATTSSRRTRRRTKARPNDLTARASAETVWVRADLRRIGIVSAILLVALGLAWVVFVVTDVLGLY
jgi:hypothetical protein